MDKFTLARGKTILRCETFPLHTDQATVQPVMQQKKILHIPNYYPPHIGGIEDVCHSIAAGLPEFSHTVICFNDKPETEDSLYENIRVIRCGVWKKLFSQSISLCFLKKLKQTFREFLPDTVHFHTPNPFSGVCLLMTLPKHVKLVLHWHSDIVEQKFIYLFYAPLEQRLLKRANVILATSPAYIEGSKPLTTFRHKVQVVQNTVNAKKLALKDEDKPEIEKIKAQYGGKKILFTFGRHVAYKGIHSLLEAVPMISDAAVIVIAGSGPLTEKLKSHPNAPRIFFPGRLSDRDLRRYLYAADVFLFPSITRNEAFGIALAEAMYCGLPSVTFTIHASGVNWVSLHRETGIEAENRNIKSMAEAINSLVSDSELRETLGKNAARRAREYFLIDAVKEKLTDLYNAI
jgi:glycosyltransferase involved in cell wall biosynthesis